MRLRFLIAFGLLAAAGCSNNGSGGTSGTVDAGSAVGRSCNVDAECGNLRCDPVRRQCICLSDSDCPANQFCSNYTGLCVDSVPGCTQDSQCDAGQFCNPATRACQDLRGFCETCASDAECGPGNHCRVDASLGESFCSKACQSASDCPSGTTCTQIAAGDSQCWPDQSHNCTSFRGCTPDLQKSCNSDADCADPANDQVCDPGSGTCKARVQVCPLGTVCDATDRVCVNSCSVDQDCVSPLACVNHICQALSTCQSDTDCPADKVCDVPLGQSEGSCVAFCSSDTDCGVGRVCQPVVEGDGSTRQACLPGCVHNSDCAPNQICEDSSGAPFVPSGTALGQCQTQLDGEPACQSTNACNTCQLCSANNQCTLATSLGYCHPCDINKGNTDCAAYGTSATCLSLAGRDASGNISSSGPYFCGVPCNPAGTADQAACPAGFVCDELLDANDLPSGVSNCVPSDFDCTSSGGTSKCP